MLSRISIAVALAAGLPLVAIGILVDPAAALGGSAVALLVAAGTTIHVREKSGSCGTTAARRSRRAGLTAGGGTLAGWLLVTGLAALLGPASGVILLTVLLSVLVIGLWWRFSPGSPRRRRSVAANGCYPSRHRLCPPSCRRRPSAWRGNTPSERCSDPSPPPPCQIVSTRQQLLDEMERRDSAGFDRWLAAGACAATDPGGYLTTE